MARIGIFGKAENRLRPVWQAAVPDHAIALAWSPDSSRLAVAAVSGPVTVFDANTGKPLHQLKGHGFGTAALAWQPTGDLLASVGQDSKVRVWDATTGQEALALDAGASWAEQVVWHPSGQYLASAAGKKAKVWSAAGELVRELPPQAGTVMDIKWRPETRGMGRSHLLAGGVAGGKSPEPRPGTDLTLLAYGAATTYDPLVSDEPVKVLAWKGSPLAMAWSPDGTILAHGNQDSTVHFWYYDASRDLQMWGYKTKVRELAWEFSSRYLATGGGPVVCIWDCQFGPNGPEGSKPLMLVGHDEESNLTALAYQSRGFLLASAALDGKVLLWQPTNRKGAQVGEYQFVGGEASALAWSPDDKSLAAGCGSGAVAVFRAG